ncbi:MFS transporter [Puniceibacterium sp. IMCC21224]|uniref:MFS transporter n=1 Tax=Puniceibacterium sp. IMCC21224 TaxID=1618204 RepID=UPI00064DA712|nr:MFS transporter [Puniceibacterium sp. IMCC21224]
MKSAPSQQRRFFAFATLLISVSTTAIDGAAISIALPTLADQFGLQSATALWVVNVYQLVVVASMLSMAALGDILGLRRVYLFGLATFTVMAGLSALAPSFGWLLFFRAIQGLAAASIMSLNFSLLRSTVPAQYLGRAMGLMAMSVAVAASIGPTLAGALLTLGPWHWIFALSFGLGALATVIGFFSLPETDNPRRPFDFPSAGLSALTFGCLLLGVSAIGHQMSRPLFVGLFVLGIGAGLVLYWRLRDKQNPLLPLDLLRIPIFALSVTASLCAFCAQMIAYVSLPFHLQDTLGFSVFQAGAVLGAWPLAIVCTAPISGMLSDRLPPGLIGCFGLGTLAIGLGMLAAQSSDVGALEIAWRLGLCGVGFALFQTPNNRTILGSAPSGRSGAAGGAQALARLIGQALGTALATLALSRFATDATIMALVIACGFSAVGAVVSALRRGPISMSA